MSISSDFLYTSSGVRQGCILAPALAVAIDWISCLDAPTISALHFWWCNVHRPRLCRWCGTFYTRLRKVAFRRSSNHHGPAHFMGKDQTTEHRSLSPSSISLRIRTSCGCHGPVCLSGQHYIDSTGYSSTDILRRVSRIFGDARQSLASEAVACMSLTKLRIYTTSCALQYAWILLREDSRRRHRCRHSTWPAKDAILGIRWNDFITNS